MPGAVLPLPADDPHPALTLALHKLWALLRPFINQNSNGEPVVVPRAGVPTPLQVLRTVAPALVHLARVFQPYSFVLIIIY